MYGAARPDCPYQDLNENNKNKKKKKSTTGKSEGFFPLERIHVVM